VQVRKGAVLSLGRLPSPASRTALKELAGNDPDAGVRTMAAQALERLTRIPEQPPGPAVEKVVPKVKVPEYAPVAEGWKPFAPAGEDLSPLLIDHVRISVMKNGKHHSQRISSEVLRDMLRSRHFLGHFKTIKEVVTTPVVVSDDTPSRPGYNAPAAILHLGPAVETAPDTATIRTFLDVMEWASPADRTNAVAALLTVPFRQRFAGAKPLILVTAAKSHSGKGTLVEFVRGKTAKADLQYEDKDWPMQRNLHQMLLQKPEIGVISLDNVRSDSSGRGKFIRTAFLESFITNAELVVTSATGRLQVLRTENKYVVILNTNEGALSIDLLNRCLPIRLQSTGNLLDRIARAKAMLGGMDVKNEWLPAHRDRIEAELWGMIDRWQEKGKPLDKDVHHPMRPWAQTVGGILRVNGFTDFLLNYNATGSAADRKREGLGILAFHAGATKRRAEDMAKFIIKHGLAKTLLVGVDTANGPACQRAAGVTLSKYAEETFVAQTATQCISYVLKKKQGRFGESFPHFRYWFEEVRREPVSKNDLGGVVLEESGPAKPPKCSVCGSEEVVAGGSLSGKPYLCGDHFEQ
jgi:hypothetical protein